MKHDEIGVIGTGVGGGSAKPLDDSGTEYFTRDRFYVYAIRNWTENVRVNQQHNDRARI